MRGLFFIFFLIVTFSCEKEIEKNIQKEKQIANLQNVYDEKIESIHKKITLHSKSKTVVENWQEYQTLTDFITKFHKTTTKESLFNSNQLTVLTQQLKDSIRIKTFDTPSFKIRLNVLHNEAMRLFDMDSITGITNKEIIQENYNITEAFNAINMKINSIVKKETLDNELLEYDYLFLTKNDQNNIKPPLKKTKIERKKNKKRAFIKKRIQPLSINKGNQE